MKVLLVHITNSKIIDLFESQLVSRYLDYAAIELKSQGIGFYTIASAGHESNVCLGDVFSLKDIALLHYRSCAFVLQRSK